MGFLSQQKAGLGLGVLVLLLTLMGGTALKFKGTGLREILTATSPLNFRLCRCPADQQVTFQRADGLTIAGSLYEPETPKTPKVGILLLHGSTPLGRNLPLYPVLAQKLSEKGYWVLTMDFPGTGESDDPFVMGTEAALDRKQDVEAALNYLSQTDLNLETIHLVAHSAGTIPAFEVGSDHSTVEKLVIIGPPRRVKERLKDVGDRNYFWRRHQEQYRTVYQRDLPNWYTAELYLQRFEKYEIRRFIPAFSQTDHPPILLMDGELEPQADREYLEQYFQDLSEPKAYVTVSQSNHYFNTLREPLLGFNIFDRQGVEKAVEIMDQFLQDK
jgi:pimeloyl-ACP methyl ester carboxylesterase